MNEPLYARQAVDAASLEALLEGSKRFGLIRLSNIDGKWYCNISMNTNTTGTEFKVESEFGMPTALSAAQQCIERMHAALKALA